MEVFDCRKEVGALAASDHKQRPLALIEYQIIHRIDVGETGVEVAEFFTDPKWHTAGRMPYHFVVLRDGRIDYCVALDKIGDAAIGTNRAGIQIAVVGDFRKHPVRPRQSEALVELCTALSEFTGKSMIEGHTDQTGRSGDINKVCPGKHLNVAGLRLEVRDRIDAKRRKQLREQGITI